MERRRMTLRRAYLWLTAVLTVVLLIVVYIGLRSQPQVVSVVPACAADTVAASSQPQTTHRQRYKSAPSSRWHQEASAPCQPESPPQTIYRKAPLVVELNSADSLDLVQLYGIGPSYAKRILKYRDLLGGFVSKSQLWEVYGMDSVRYNLIAPHITVDAQNIRRMDINSAALDQLKRHPYIDYYQAKAIVQTRERAGLFAHIDDLKQVGLIDNESFNKIYPYLICNSQLNK